MEPVNHDWIEWNGGECPVSADTTIELKFRQTPHEIDVEEEPHSLRWMHTTWPSGTKGGGDIIAYRVVSP